MFSGASLAHDDRCAAPRWAVSSLEGDYYQENEDVCRGVTLRSDTVVAGSDANMDWNNDILEASKGTVTSGNSVMPLGVSGEMCISPEVRFQKGDAPPDLPADTSFQLEVTSGYVCSSSPVEMGNRLLDFFNKRMDAIVRKVSREKFSIKAEVCSDGAACELKVRMYQKEFGFAFEFQRRRGDTIVFNRVYREAVDVCMYAQQTRGSPVTNSDCQSLAAFGGLHGSALALLRGVFIV